MLETLAELFVTDGLPAHIRSDNGPECTATLIREWLAALNVDTLFIEPGSPWENRYVESFNGKLTRRALGPRDLLYVNGSHDLDRTVATGNTVRPHSALGYRPPAPAAISPASLNGVLMSPALSQELAQPWGAGQGHGVRLLREDNHRYRRTTADEERRLLEAAHDDPRMTARIIAASDIGMRRGEMLLLQNRHILWGEDLIRIVGANAKSRKERRVPIATTRLRSVVEQRAFLGPAAYVFGNECGERQVDFRDTWMRILKAARITDKQNGLDGDLCWYDFRSSRPPFADLRPSRWYPQVIETMVPEGGVEPPRGVNLTGF